MKYSAVIFDWAGTMIDFGSFAPMGAFVEAFSRFDIQVSIEDARKPMGKPKWDHIHAMLEIPHIREMWAQKYGQEPDDNAVDQVYEIFVPINEGVVANYATLVPGAIDMLANMRQRGLRIGSTTGYTRSIMERVLPVAEEQGYSPENLVCADDLPIGRPTAIGMYKCCVDLGIGHVSALIKVDDTVPGIAEGVAAGCLTIGVSLSGNYAGKTLEEINALSESEVDLIRQQASDKLRKAGADHVIDSVADLPALLDRLGIN